MLIVQMNYLVRGLVALLPLLPSSVEWDQLLWRQNLLQGLMGSLSRQDWSVEHRCAHPAHHQHQMAADENVHLGESRLSSHQHVASALNALPSSPILPSLE